MFNFFSVSLCFSLAFFGLPLFQFLLLCLSISLSCYFLSFFLLVFLVCFLLVPSFCLFLCFFCLICCCFVKGTTSKYSHATFCFINPLFCLVSCLVFKSLFLIFDFSLILSYDLFSTSMFLASKTLMLKNTNYWSKGGLQQDVFFYERVFCKM